MESESSYEIKNVPPPINKKAEDSSSHFDSEDQKALDNLKFGLWIFIGFLIAAIILIIILGAHAFY
jgi:hypothetical protein